MGAEIFRKRYDPQRDIDILRKSLRKIQDLKDVNSMPGFQQIREKFKIVIDAYAEDILKACKEPAWNESEIKCKTLVWEGLGWILASIDTDIKGEKSVRKSLKDKLKEASERTQEKQYV